LRILVNGTNEFCELLDLLRFQGEFKADNS